MTVDQRRTSPAVAERGPARRPRAAGRRRTAVDDARRRGPRASPTTTARSSRGLSVEIPPGKITVIVGPNACGKSTLLRALARLLKPKRGHGAARRQVDPPDCRRKAVATKLGILPAVAGRPRGHHRRRPRRPRPLPAPGLVPAVDGGGPRRRRRGAGGDRHARHRRPPGRRAVGRPAPAGVDRHDAGPGHRADAARRADDVPRPRPPGRGARPARRPQPARGPHDRARPPRPQPRLPLRPPPDRHARRARSSPRARPTTSSRPSSSPTCSGCRAGSSTTRCRRTPMVVPIGRHLNVDAET